MESYSRGRRGVPAKDVGVERRARVQIPHSPPMPQYVVFFILKKCFFKGVLKRVPYIFFRRIIEIYYFSLFLISQIVFLISSIFSNIVHNLCAQTLTTIMKRRNHIFNYLGKIAGFYRRFLF